MENEMVTWLIILSWFAGVLSTILFLVVFLYFLFRKYPGPDTYGDIPHESIRANMERQCLAQTKEEIAKNPRLGIYLDKHYRYVYFQGR